MEQYNREIQLLKNENIIKENFKVSDDNLIIDFSNFLQVILHKEGKMLDMYINNHHFGDIGKNDIVILFKSLLMENKVFIEYRRPVGYYAKDYFKIMNLEEYEKKKKKLLKRRGTKIYTINKLIIDLY